MRLNKSSFRKALDEASPLERKIFAVLVILAILVTLAEIIVLPLKALGVF